jgi:hypothetical protein
MNAHQRRKQRRRFNGKLPGVQRRLARFKRRLCGVVQIPMKYLFQKEPVNAAEV